MENSPFKPRLGYKNLEAWQKASLLADEVSKAVSSFRGAAAELRDPGKFADFYLDEWPTLAWRCGFDLSPEYLYELLTGTVPTWSQQSRAATPVVAEEKARYKS